MRLDRRLLRGYYYDDRRESIGRYVWQIDEDGRGFEMRGNTRDLKVADLSDDRHSLEMTWVVSRDVRHSR